MLAVVLDVLVGGVSSVLLRQLILFIDGIQDGMLGCGASGPVEPAVDLGQLRHQLPLYDLRIGQD